MYNTDITHNQNIYNETRTYTTSQTHKTLNNMFNKIQ